MENDELEKECIVISESGASKCSDTTPDNLKVFKSIGELRNCLFKRCLRDGR